MRTLKLVFIIGLIAASVGFVSLTDTAGDNEANVNENKSPVISLSAVDFIDKGDMVASWYGPRFHGKLTANGEIYNQMALTAAHKTLPFGTVLRITNLENGKTALVRINDRGPYIQGRSLDLSKGAALNLGMMHEGVIKVKVEEVELNLNSPPVLTYN